MPMHTTCQFGAASPENIASIPSKQRIARTFGLKALRYDSHAAIQGALIRCLLHQYSLLIRSESLWTDLGCGTGLFSRECDVAGLSPCIVGLDIAMEPLLQRTKNSRRVVVQADIDAPPFKNKSFDGAVVSSVLQWLEDPQPALQRIAAILEPGGCLLFAGFVAGSFAELFTTRVSFGLPVSANCPEPAVFRHGLAAAGFTIFDHEILQNTSYFPTASALLKNISGLGGTAVSGRHLGRKELAAFCRAYEQEYITTNGIPLTWRGLICACRKGNLP